MISQFKKKFMKNTVFSIVLEDKNLVLACSQFFSFTYTAFTVQAERLVQTGAQ